MRDPRLRFWSESGSVRNSIDDPRTVCDVMMSDVVELAPATPFRAIARTLVEHGIEAAAVVDASGLLVGIVTVADLLPKEEPAALLRHHLFEARARRELRRRASALTAVDLMSTPAVTATPETSLRAAAGLLVENGINQLPVVDSSGSLVGLLRRADLLRVFLRDPERIRDEIRSKVVERRLGLNSHELEISVDEGIVTLEGQVQQRSDAAAIASAVREVDGVIAVRDRLTYCWDDLNATPLEQGLALSFGSGRERR